MYGLLIALVIIWIYSGKGYETLKAAIENEINAEVTILLKDQEKQIVIFKREDGNYLFNTYEKNNDKYIYSTDGENGGTFSTASGVLEPYLLNIINNKKSDYIMWGAIKSKEKIESVTITFKLKNNPEVKFNYEPDIIENNSFLFYLPNKVFDPAPEQEKEWIIDTKVSDKEGEIIAKKHKLKPL